MIERTKENSHIANRKSQISLAPSAKEFYKRNIEKEADDRLLQFLSFIVDDEEYALELHETKEVVKMREITEVPHAPHFIAGIISLRGEIIPVISLQKRLGLKEKDITSAARMVIAFHTDIGSFASEGAHPSALGGGADAHYEPSVEKASNGVKIGLIVDRIMGVVRLNPEEIEPAPPVHREAGAEFIRGVVHYEDRLIMLLNIPMLCKIVN